MSRTKRYGGAAVGLVALLVANVFVVGFVAGFTLALGEYTSAGILAVMAGFVFVAPFNYALFQRALDYMTDGGASE